MNNLRHRLRSIGRLILAYLFPPRCPACDTVTGSLIEGDMCKDCREKFDNEFVNECQRCGEKPNLCECVPKMVADDSDISPYTTVFSLIFSGYYTGYDEESVISSLVYAMKRDHASGSKLLFARIIAQSVSRELTLKKMDSSEFTVTFIPRSGVSFEKYGFDHMEYVARYVSEMLGCRFENFLLRKGGEAQKGLSFAERYSNAYESLSLDPRKTEQIHGKKIILLDDIVTTGSSMRAAVSKLSFAGASMIMPASAMISMKEKHEKTA